MHKISDIDKKIWEFYTSSLNSTKKVNVNKQIKASNISKVLKTNVALN